MILYRLVISFAIFSCCASPCVAQTVGPSAIDAAGRSVAAGGNSYDYAIGQVVAGNTFSSSSLIVTPGVIQPNISANSIAGPRIKPADLKVYPSPAEHSVFLKAAFGASGTLQWSLYSMDGKLVHSNSTILRTGNETQEVDVSAFAAGNYMLQVGWMQAGVRYTSGYKIQKVR